MAWFSPAALQPCGQEAMEAMKATAAVAAVKGGQLVRAAQGFHGKARDPGRGPAVSSWRKWNSHTHRQFPGKFEASNLSRDNHSREIGRRWTIQQTAARLSRPPGWVRPISVLRLSLLRFGDSNIPGNPLWTWEFHPSNIRFSLSQTLWNPESSYGYWP